MAHLIIPLLSVMAAALLAILVPRETLGATGLTVIAIAAGFLLWVALTAVLGVRKVKREMLSEFVVRHSPQTETSVCLDLYVKDTVAVQAISCVVIEPDEHEIMSPATPQTPIPVAVLSSEIIAPNDDEGRYLDYFLNYPSDFAEPVKPIAGGTYQVVWWIREKEGEGWIEVAQDSFDWTGS